MYLNGVLKNDNLFNLAFQHASIGMGLAAPNGTVLKANSSACFIVGYSEEELKAISFQEITHPDDMEQDIELVQQLFAGKQSSFQREKRYIHKLGHIVWVLLSVTLVKDETEQPLFFITQFSDNSKQKMAEDELKKTKERLESFIHNNADAIWVIDKDDRVIEVNKAFESMFGWTVGEIVGRKLPIIPIELAEIIEGTHACIKNGESLIGFETIRQRKDGSRLEVSTTISPLKSADGTIIGLTGLCRDVSEQKRANKDLKETKELLESFMDNNLDPILIYNAKDRIIRVNKAYERIFGWTAGELIGLHLSELQQIPPEHTSDIEKLVTIMKAGQSVAGYETVRKKKDGTLMNVSLSCFPIFNEKGYINGWSLILRDITERKQAEELMLNSEKLSLAGQLAAGIAHEIRNPLTAIKGFVKLLQSGYGEKQEYYDIMTSEIERIEIILSELLILAKPQVSKFERKDIRALLAQVTTLLDTQAILNNVQIVTEFSPGITHIYCDENQLKQVCINFIKNSIEAMPDGGTITIQLRRVDHDHILLRFIDQGCGISEYMLKKLGQPFYSTKEKGTGLGFMVSKRIIENHDGRIEIFSEEKKGTTIEVVLPTPSRLPLV